MKTSRVILATGVAFVVAALPLLGAGGAILGSTAGTVTVNGHKAAGGSTVLAGEAISVGANGTVRMTLLGGSVTAASRTNLRLVSADGIELFTGMVKVSGAESASVATGAITVKSTGGSSSFAVLSASGRTWVETTSGNVAIVDTHSGETIATVPAGKAVSLPNGNAPGARAVAGAANPVMVGALAGLATGIGVVVYTTASGSNAATPS